MNIVIVNHYAGSPALGMEFRPYYLAKQWIKNGHSVMIVGGSFSHLRTKQPTVDSAITKRSMEGIEYVWIKINEYHGNNLGRIFSMFLFTLRLYTSLRPTLDAFKPDLIIASSTYPLDNLPVFSLAKRYKALFCYEVHDLWPLSPMELGGYSKYHPFIMVMQWAENFAYRNADLVVSMLPKTLDHMVSHGLKKEKFCYIPNGIAIDEWQSHSLPEEHSRLINKLRAEKKTLVGYAGGHALSNALDNLIAAAAIADKAAPHLAFILVGDGVEKEKLIYESQRLSLRNIHFMPSIPKRTVPELLSSMDILYLGWHNNSLYRFGISPNKLIDYMMAGKPVVHSVNAGNDMVQEAGCGISVEPENPKAIMDACLQISRMSKEAQIEMGAKGKAFILQNNDYEILAQKFIDCAVSRK